MRRRGRPPVEDLLTPAEWRVTDGVRHGLSNPQIAARRGVGVDAVKYHVSNTLQKLGLADRRALQLWAGLPRGCALSSSQPGECDVDAELKLGPIGQIARTVSDTAAAERWYREVLGLPHLFTFGTLAFFDCGGVRLMLSQGEAGAESLIYFRVSDLPACWKALQERGAKGVSAPHRIHQHADGSEEWMAFIEDNDGRPIGLMSRVAASAA
ncbi:VOC family protein [Pseudomarimonas salicorniae]|uniref:LuxR C-terminal-related transcriptional regulator n=1 Tax=Pseudomarimonas salicorniae TaxID=2933270 RepID=A0ABT0GM07_9GAMM|nr:VOC family protein [Lysobacter sp. CAU 1642]MCK7595581.1 LuxR C-terminal-related transcriptional regulator [Lysobacter sp. CAU 1642]